MLSGNYKESYLKMIEQFGEWEKQPRQLRFCLPEICVFANGHPIYWVSKAKDNQSTKVIRNKLKMNMF